MYAPWMIVARNLIGTKELPGKRHNKTILGFLALMKNIGRWGKSRDETPWCAAFVEYCLQQVGLEGTGNATARSYATWGRPSKIATGAITVIKRKATGSDRTTGSRAGFHVGFLVRISRHHYVILGGNQGDAVSVRYFSKKRYTLVALRRPVHEGLCECEPSAPSYAA